MSFSRDIQDYQYSTPRSLQTSKFGPYSRLTVERKREAKAWVWAIGCGIAVGVFWWIVVAIRVGV